MVQSSTSQEKKKKVAKQYSFPKLIQTSQLYTLIPVPIGQSKLLAPPLIAAFIPTPFRFYSFTYTIFPVTYG